MPEEKKVRIRVPKTPMTLQVIATDQGPDGALYLTEGGGTFKTTLDDGRKIEGNFCLSIGGGMVIVRFEKPERKQVVVDMSDLIKSVIHEVFK